MNFMKNYDLIVIGSGSAGGKAAVGCSKAGWKVAVIDKQPFGGTCAQRGCDPKKILVGAAEIIHRIEHMKEKGFQLPDSNSLEYYLRRSKRRAKKRSLNSNICC